MKITYKLILILFFIIFFLITYLSLFGVQTEKFNSQISNKIKKIDKDLEIELKEIKLILDPIKFKLKIKTIGSKLKYKKKIIKIEKIKTSISLKALINNKFSIENLDISSNSLEINQLISFIRSINNSPELFILEKVIKGGYLIADIRLEFDDKGKIKKNFMINGLVKDIKIDLLKKYNLKNLNFIFNYQNKKLNLGNISLSLNNLSLFSDDVSVENINNYFLIGGNIEHKVINFSKENLNLFVKPFIKELDIEKLKFSSNNTFSFKIKKKYQLDDLNINSKIFIDEISLINNFKLKNLFPKIKNEILLKNNQLEFSFEPKKFSIKGGGKILVQDQDDEITYNIDHKNKILNFKTALTINDNPFEIDFLNYRKIPKQKLLLNLQGQKKENNQILINLFSLNEKKNKIEINDLIFNDQMKIKDIKRVNLKFIDKENQKNSANLYKKNGKFHLDGSILNVNNLIDRLLKNDKDQSNIVNINNSFIINIDKILLDNEHDLKNFSGFVNIKNQQIEKAELSGNFSNKEKFKFTVNTNKNEKITTLYADKAEPLVRRYKFIKGFDEGSIDFYSSEKFGKTRSTLKIYDFKLKELPALTKILTLASLQGIADILSGEGIRFNEFEMNFQNNKDQMTIDEIYAIGPAISILMNGYIEKNKLISLRGTLVPATTINKFIGSLPVLGKILVGSKTGEGVFGVSFKIKGPPKKLQTTVNPIKTLTPRFITRTLEKIKKN